MEKVIRDFAISIGIGLAVVFFGASVLKLALVVGGLFFGLPIFMIGAWFVGDAVRQRVSRR